MINYKMKEVLIFIIVVVLSLNLIQGFSIGGEFEITGESIPKVESVPSGGGGGSSRLIPEQNITENKTSEEKLECNVLWNCTKWQGCANTTQIRICTDINYCKKPYTKIEEKKCEIEIPKIVENDYINILIFIIIFLLILLFIFK